MGITEQQRAAIETRAPRICVSAGAGSGKTFVLVQRVVDLLRGGADLDDIAAITFTEKAAAEMKARLRKAFRELAEPKDLEAMSRWRDYERRLDTARISTIHAFCMRLLKENALKLGLDPDFSLLSEPQSRLMVRETSRETLHALLSREDPHVIRLCAEWSLPRLRDTLAGLAGRAHELVKLTADWPRDDAWELVRHWRRAAEGVRWEEACSPSTARRMRQLRRSLESFAGACGEPEKCGREIRRLFYLEAIEEFLAGGWDAEGLRSLGLRVDSFKCRNGVKSAWPSEASYKELEVLQKKVKETFEEICLPPDHDDELDTLTAELTQALVHVVSEFALKLNEAKQRRNALDFDDLVWRSAEALAGDPALRETASAGLKHLLMDEFQDTDHTQLAIAESLCSVPGGPSLFLVGDAKQSIYRFRGAEVGVFREVRDSVESLLLLSRNFRSGAGILHFVNHFFQESELLGAVEPEFGVLTPHRAGGEQPGVEFLIATPEGEDKLNAAESRATEAALIAARIHAICAGPPVVWDENTEAYRQARPGDVAILLRAMSHVHHYTEALHRAGIEYGVVAGAGFYERQEVIDILNLLKVVLDPFDEPALLAVLRGPLCGLRDDTLALLCMQAPLPPAFFSELVPEGIRDAQALEDARALLADLLEQRDQPVDALMDYLLHRTHFEAMLLAMPNGVQAASNLRKLADLAAEFAASGAQSLLPFVDYLDDMRSAVVREGDALLQPQEGGAVTLMTVHKSKGLEFPIVILADASAGLSVGRNTDLPWHRELGTALTPPGASSEKQKAIWKEVIQRRNKREELEEHARLLYVGLTRARDLLVVSGSETPSKDGWLHLLDDVYQVTARADGESIFGEGWQAVVRRSVRAAALGKTTVTQDRVDWDAVFERAASHPAYVQRISAISVSTLLNEMETGLGDEEEREKEPDMLAKASSFALLRGTLVHELFEHWSFGESPDAVVEEILAEAPVGPAQLTKLRDTLHEVVERFTTLPLHDELAKAETLLREHAFVLRVGDCLVRGTIDAMLGDDTLIDYKTGAWNAEKHARYQWQLRLYAAAARALTGVLPCRGVLVYVDVPRVEEFIITQEEVDAAISLAEHVLGQQG